ncbi:MAG: glycosyltransferase family 2 protein [Candidatus Zhuqueibacterota bacterium]
MPPKYAIITPARNEEKYIDSTIASVLSQTAKPAIWVIIDDHSTDRTREIIDAARDEFPWIQLLENDIEAERAPGAKVVRLFNLGIDSLKDEYDFLVKLDADLSFRPDYFERLFLEFERDPHLGIAGGYCQNQDGQALKTEWTPEYHVRGATKVYRKKCLSDIGGLIPVMGWDGLDEMKAQMLGWNTKSFKDLLILHLRHTGQATGKIRFAWLWGVSSHYMGYDPIFFLIRCMRNIKRRPYLLFSMTMVFGYLYSLVVRSKQVDDKNLILYIRKFQRRRLFSNLKFINRKNI